MIPGPDDIVACPHCSALGRAETLRSSNTFGATAWLDGKTTGPMVGNVPPFVCCPACGGCFWVDKARRVGSIERYNPSSEQRAAIDPAWAQAPLLAEPTEAQYYEALPAQATAQPERFGYLRMRAWWRGNDAYRVAPDKRPLRTWPQGFTDNLEAFVLLPELDKPNNLPLKAEALRELGRFDEALALLANVPTGELDHVVKRISQLCRECRREVEPLESP